MNYLYFDGDCPFCSRYVQYIRIEKSLGKLQLVNAREDSSIRNRLRKHGIDLNKGMLLTLGDNYYFGPECIHMLAILSTESDCFNRINGFLFQSRMISVLLYPLMKLARRVTLFILKIHPI
ncbi:MAG: DUF393 domain-containing protein [Pseudomonadales bacterium]|nr:DUF393 domain-containing protein [Pseudomonadales bacterium]